MRRLKKIRGLLLLAGLIGTLPFSIRGLTWLAVSISLRDTPSHKVAIGPCRLSLEGLSFRNIDIQWRDNRFSCDELEIKIPGPKSKGRRRVPVVFHHPQLLLTDQPSCQTGLKAAIGVLFKLDPFVNHGVVEVIQAAQEVPLLANSDPLSGKEKRPKVHRYYFWSEYLNPQEKIFFFDRSPLPQGEAIASLLIRRDVPTSEQYELRIDNLDGSTLLSLVNQQLGSSRFAIRSAPEGLVSLRAQGTWNGEKLKYINLEMEGIYAFLSHPHGVVKADEWSARASLEELSLEPGKIALPQIQGQLELRGMEINDDLLSQYIHHGELNIALQHGMISGHMMGSLHRDSRPYKIELRGTADLIQRGLDLGLNLEDPQGQVSQMEISAQFSKHWEGLVSFSQFPIHLLSSSALSLLGPNLPSTKGGISSETISTSRLPKNSWKILALPLEGKLNGYSQISFDGKPRIQEADLELHDFSMLNRAKDWEIHCSKVQLSLLKDEKMDLLLKTMPIMFEYRGIPTGEAQFQISQNPATKLTGYIEGNFQGQPMTLSWVGDLSKGDFSFTSSEYPSKMLEMNPSIASLLSGLQMKGSWNQEKDRLSVELEKLFDSAHAEVIVFEDGSGGFYFEKIPVKELLPLLVPKAGLTEGTVRGCGQWSGGKLESTLEVDQFSCSDFIHIDSTETALNEASKALTVRSSSILPEIKIECKVDFNLGDLALQTEPFQFEFSHPFAMQKINFSGTIQGNQHRISFNGLKLDSEWGSFQGSGYYALQKENPEMKLELGGGEIIFEKGASSIPLQAFLEDRFGSFGELETLSLAIPENALQIRFSQNPITPESPVNPPLWKSSFLLMGHLDLPLFKWSGTEIEEFEAQIIASDQELSLQEGRCAFDLPGGRKVRCEEIALLLSPERKELFSKIDLGSLSLMNLHLHLDTQGDEWKLHSQKSVFLGRPLEFFAVGSKKQITKWSITTALDGALTKPTFKSFPSLLDHPMFSQDIAIEIASDFGRPDQFSGKVMDMNISGQCSSTSCLVIAEKEDVHFDASLSWLGKVIEGKGSAITPHHKIGFSTQYNWERVEGLVQIQGDSLGSKLGLAPLRLRYLLDLYLEPLSTWRAELKQFDGTWNEYTLRLTEPTQCKIQNGALHCAGSLEALKDKTSWAKGKFELNKSIMGAALDVDFPKLHLSKNIDFLNPARLSFESDLLKLAEIDITCSDVELYLVDFKEKVTLCNPEIALSLSGGIPLHFRSLLKTSYNPFDLDLKIDPKKQILPAEFAFNDKVTGEHLIGGFSFSGKEIIPQYFHGNFLGSYLEGKRNGEKFSLTFRVPLMNQVLCKSYPSLSKLHENPLFAKATIEVQGNVIQLSEQQKKQNQKPVEGWVFLGNAQVKGFDLKNAPRGTISSQVQYRNKELSLIDLQTNQMPFDLKVKKALFQFGDEETHFRIPAIMMKNFIPSQLLATGSVSGQGSAASKNSWNLTHVSLIDFHGEVTQTQSWKGRGTAHFANMQKGQFTFTKNFSMALEQMGLSSSTLRPAVGDVDFSLDHGKVILEDLRSCFSEGGATAFILSPSSRHFIHFDGTINVELEPKPIQGLPWTQHVHLKIKGKVDQPEYQVR